MSPSQVIVLATPVFLLLIAIEFAVGLRRGRNTYRLSDAVSSIGLGMLSQVGAVFAQLLRLGIYTAVYTHAALLPDTGSGPPPWAGCWRCWPTTFSTTGTTAWATGSVCSGPRTWCTTRASTTTSPPRCASR